MIRSMYLALSSGSFREATASEGGILGVALAKASSILSGILCMLFLQCAVGAALRLVGSLPSARLRFEDRLRLSKLLDFIAFANVVRRVCLGLSSTRTVFAAFFDISYPLN